MYTVFYIYRVPKEKVDVFLELTREAAGIYREWGAVEAITLKAADAGSKYGCVGLAEAVPPGDDEELLLGYDSFHDAVQFRQAMDKIDDDPRIKVLFAQMQTIIDLSRVVRGEFGSIV